MCLNVAFGRKGLSIILRFWKLPRVSFWLYKKISKNQIEKHIAISLALKFKDFNDMHKRYLTSLCSLRREVLLRK